MGVKFMGKNPKRKFVRQIQRVFMKNTEKTNETKKVEENKQIKEEKDMSDERLEKIEKIMGEKAPKRRVKVEKKDKGLIERTENSTILLTEDNKMLLND